ncbi:MAG: hypothetical protein C4562_03285 [Actinobacteria bacterium]|nr:MAG: hypothetical protein C4562_03285 [Actinomycetota bacterium]
MGSGKLTVKRFRIFKDSPTEIKRKKYIDCTNCKYLTESKHFCTVTVAKKYSKGQCRYKEMKTEG